MNQPFTQLSKNEVSWVQSVPIINHIIVAGVMELALGQLRIVIQVRCETFLSVHLDGFESSSPRSELVRNLNAPCRTVGPRETAMVAWARPSVNAVGSLLSLSESWNSYRHASVFIFHNWNALPVNFICGIESRIFMPFWMHYVCLSIYTFVNKRSSWLCKC
jgi:hypothetical protein